MAQQNPYQSTESTGCPISMLLFPLNYSLFIKYLKFHRKSSSLLLKDAPPNLKELSMSTCSTSVQRDGKLCLQRWECVGQDMGQIGYGTGNRPKILQLSKTICHLNCILSRLIDDSHIQTQACASLSSCTIQSLAFLKLYFIIFISLQMVCFQESSYFTPFFSTQVLATTLIKHHEDV